MTKSTLLALIALSLSACATVQGAGVDLANAGQTLTATAQDVQSQM